MTEQTRNLQRRHLIFYLEVFDDETGELLGHLVDLTDTGVKLISKNTVPEGKKYTMRIALPEEYFKDDKFLRFPATSRWSRSAVNPDFYDSGFQLGTLDRKTADLIIKLIHTLGFSDNQ